MRQTDVVSSTTFTAHPLGACVSEDTCKDRRILTFTPVKHARQICNMIWRLCQKRTGPPQNLTDICGAWEGVEDLIRCILAEHTALV